MRRKVGRRLFLESLESRTLLATDLHNFITPMDVNDDGRVSASDALHIVNQLNVQGRVGAGPLAGGFSDVNGDGRVSSFDALMVINRLNQRSLFDSNDESRWVRLDTPGSLRAAARLDRGADGAELEVRIHNGQAGQTHALYLDDTWVGSIETDHLGRGKLKLDPKGGLDGVLPGLLTQGRPLVQLSIESVGQVQLHGEGEAVSEAAAVKLASTANSDAQDAKVLAARLTHDGQTRGQSLLIQRGDRKFLAVFARGLTAGETYSVQIDGVQVASVKANRVGVVAQRLQLDDVPDFPDVKAGSEIELGSYSGQFKGITKRPAPDTPNSFYAAYFNQGRIRGAAELIRSQGRTVLGVQLGRVEPGSTHGLYIDDVKIAEVKANRVGLIFFRHDSGRGDKLLNELPAITSESVMRVGEVARAKLNTIAWR